MGSPRECPRCGGENVGHDPRGDRRPSSVGSVLVRHRVCNDCGYRGITGEFWAVGERSVGIMEELTAVYGNSTIVGVGNV